MALVALSRAQAFTKGCTIDCEERESQDTARDPRAIEPFRVAQFSVNARDDGIGFWYRPPLAFTRAESL